MADMLNGRNIALVLSHAADLIALGESVMNLPNCNECGKKRECKYVPDWGSPVRFNCPLFEMPKEASADEAHDD